MKKKELTPNEIIFCPSCSEAMKNADNTKSLESYVAFDKIKKALMIKKNGFNIYCVDSFSKEKIEALVEEVSKIYEAYNPPKDICYVTSKDALSPSIVKVESGKGHVLQKLLQDVKENYYECINEFYTTSNLTEKECIIEKINEERNNSITYLMKKAKEQNFELKSTNEGFVFIPTKNSGNKITQEEYDDLEESTQEDIEKQASKLKILAEEILEKLRDAEIVSIEKLKDIYRKYLNEYMCDYKESTLSEFVTNDEVYRYLGSMFENVEKKIVDCYTIRLEDDTDEIEKIFDDYNINVIVNNERLNHPRVIYEEEPTVSNLIGNIEYRNVNGTYSTDISLISAGSLVKANEGCIILRLSSLINSSNGMSYYYLKKALIHNKVDYSYSKNYLEMVAIEGVNPEPIPIDTKVILIGDYESFAILYDKDEDFKKIFSVKIETIHELKYGEEAKQKILSYVKERIKRDKLLNISNEAAAEFIKFLSRLSGSRKRISIDEYNINKILYLADINARMRRSKNINRNDVLEAAYEEEDIMKMVMDSYKDGKILLSVKDKKIGIINGLAVLGTQFYSFGKPIRITCLATQGNGNIIDVHKESKMSGNIHEKSISILKGVLASLLNPYKKLPVDFQLSFEQTYGMIEGDSASVAEIVCILSALSKMPIRQNIAVTGSINQMGEIQPIGGVNEKIEGFFKVCSIIDTVEEKGVLIPSYNKDELILNHEVEEAIKNNKFHIYTMDNLEDALRILIFDENDTIENFIKKIESEISKYKNEKEKNKKKN